MTCVSHYFDIYFIFLTTQKIRTIDNVKLRSKEEDPYAVTWSTLLGLVFIYIWYYDYCSLVQSPHAYMRANRAVNEPGFVELELS